MPRVGGKGRVHLQRSSRSREGSIVNQACRRNETMVDGGSVVFAHGAGDRIGVEVQPIYTQHICGFELQTSKEGAFVTRIDGDRDTTSWLRSTTAAEG